MQIEVFEIRGGGKSVLRTFPDFAGAAAYVIGLGCWAFEVDPAYPDCADAFTRGGLVLSIQPEGFTL